MTVKATSEIIKAFNKPNPKFFIAEQSIGLDVHFGMGWDDQDIKKIKFMNRRIFILSEMESLWERYTI